MNSKNLFRILTLGLSLLIGSALVTSCKKDEKPTTKAKLTAEQLKGDWQAGEAKTGKSNPVNLNDAGAAEKFLLPINGIINGLFSGQSGRGEEDGANGGAPAGGDVTTPSKEMIIARLKEYTEAIFEVAKGIHFVFEEPAKDAKEGKFIVKGIPGLTVEPSGTWEFDDDDNKDEVELNFEKPFELDAQATINDRLLARFFESSFGIEAGSDDGDDVEMDHINGKLHSEISIIEVAEDLAKKLENETGDDPKLVAVKKFVKFLNKDFLKNILKENQFEAMKENAKATFIFSKVVK